MRSKEQLTWQSRILTLHQIGWNVVDCILAMLSISKHDKQLFPTSDYLTT
jgi:hypothetical protein